MALKKELSDLKEHLSSSAAESQRLSALVEKLESDVQERDSKLKAVEALAVHKSKEADGGRAQAERLTAELANLRKETEELRATAAKVDEAMATTARAHKEAQLKVRMAAEVVCPALR